MLQFIVGLIIGAIIGWVIPEPTWMNGITDQIKTKIYDTEKPTVDISVPPEKVEK